MPVETRVPETAMLAGEAEFIPQADLADGNGAATESQDAGDESDPGRKSLAQKVRTWLGRAA
jgi:hypothetical protein